MLKVNDQVKNPSAEIEVPAFFAGAITFSPEPETLTVIAILENRRSTEGTRYQESVIESSDPDAFVITDGPLSTRRYRLRDLRQA